MYDVCIADDEVLIQKSITARLRASGNPIRVSGCADNAEKAMGLYWTSRPDIFFVDINMPGTDGLSMVRRIREEDPACTTKFIIITGYDDFTHMREAIRSGVMDYLKKPITTEEFNAVINSAIKVIQQERKKPPRNENGIIPYEEYIADTPKILNGGTLLAVYAPNPELLNIPSETNPEGAGNRIPVLLSGDEKNECLCLDFPIIGNLRFYYAPGTPVSRRILLQNFNPLVSTAGMFFVYVHPESERLDLLTERIDQSMNLRFLRHGIAECIPQRITSAADMGLLDYTLDHGQSDAGRKAINGYLRRIIFDEGTIPELSVLYRQIILLLINKHAANHLPIPNPLKAGFSPFALCRYPSLESLRDQLCGVIAALTQKIGEKGRGGELISTICEYLKQNYMENITQNDLASHFYVTPPYLSRRFKEKMGTTYGEYLENIRMEKALEYLEESEAQIVEISEKVGYKDPNYFTKVFKKKYQKSPSDYRTHLKGNQEDVSLE
jgi:two-component system response regulator YesN